jgi:NADPH-dependent curcumin reductase
MNRQIILSKRPRGVPQPTDFELIERALPTPSVGQVLLRHEWLGLAPAARLRMGEEASYSKPMALGDVVYGQAVGTVIESKSPAFSIGDKAVSMNGGWQEYSVAGGATLSRIDLGLAAAPSWLGPLGTSGMTAYVGLLDFGKPASGDTVLVSAASGAVGCMVGQLARLKGCRTVGIAGGAAKCELARFQYGFDVCVDYRSAAFRSELQAACPAGVDILFENVGGAGRDAAWDLLNHRARVVVCGLIAEYNSERQAGPGWFSILAKRLSLQGFILSDHLRRRDAFLADMAGWISEGAITMKEDVRHGLEQVVPSFIDMLEGRNVGKTLVKL